MLCTERYDSHAIEGLGECRVTIPEITATAPALPKRRPVVPTLCWRLAFCTPLRTELTPVTTLLPPTASVRSPLSHPPYPVLPHPPLPHPSSHYNSFIIRSAFPDISTHSLLLRSTFSQPSLSRPTQFHHRYSPTLCASFLMALRKNIFPFLPSPSSLLTIFLLLSLLTFSTSTTLGPPDLSQTIHDYLANGGHQTLKRAFNLPDHVIYNPLHFFTREDAGQPVDTRAGPSFLRPSSHRPSDLQLLRAMGLHVPGVDPEENLLNLSARSSQQCGDGGLGPVPVVGTKSQIIITYTTNTPVEVRSPVEFAVKKWADEFESSVPLRICFAWAKNTVAKQTLGATSTPFVTTGEVHPNLRDDSIYNPALASALAGEDMISADKYHVHMLLNNRIDWHKDTSTQATNRQYDLSTTVLHELTHGLFFSGTIKVPSSGGTATYSNQRPGRFDQFMKVVGDIGVVRACKESKDLFNAVTSDNLRFFDEQSGSNFGLFAPYPFASGSSMYHFNNTRALKQDCAAMNIATDNEMCSDLMTHELLPDYTQRVLGETTLRVYRAMKSSAAGAGRGRKCDVPDSSKRAPSGEGSSSPSAAAPSFTLPPWGIAAVAVLGGVGAILVFGVIVSSVAGRAPSSSSR